MTEPDRPIHDDDLHAYVDNQIDADRRAAVERYLATHPDSARTVAAYQAQRDTVRAAFAARRAEPLPPELDLTRIVATRLRRRRTPWRIAASIVLALGAGGAGGWLLHGRPFEGRSAQAMAALQQEAFATYTVYAADRLHPIEVSAAQETHLRQWLSKRLERQVAPPDLSAFGYRLIGGRLLATEHGGAAALFMYDDAKGDRLSLLLRPMAADLLAGRTDIGSAAMNGCAWIEKGMGYAVVARLPDAELDRIATGISTTFAAAG